MLADCEDETVLNAVSDYVSAAPSFSLEGGTYSEVQEVTISSSTGGTIYYTTDGTDPTASSEEYREPILLQNEGEVVIKAIAINDKEIPSIASSAKYTIEFPIASAPAVNRLPDSILSQRRLPLQYRMVIRLIIQWTEQRLPAIRKDIPDP